MDIQYQRNDVAFERGKFRVRGDTIEVWPAYEEFGLRIELFGDEVDALAIINPISGEVLRQLDELYIYPAKHFVTPEERIKEAIKGIEQELNERLERVQEGGQAARGAAAARPGAATTWRCCARSATARASRTTPAGSAAGKPGEPPYTLLDFFPEDFL